MGGELILLGLGGCFMSNLLAAIRERQAPISDVQLTVSAQSEGAPPRMTGFVIRISAEYDDQATLDKIVTIAERGCIASNTLKQGSSISVIVDDTRPTGAPKSAASA